jgi:hypothetical protein
MWFSSSSRWLLAATLVVGSSGFAYAGCSSVKNCDKSDFTSAAKKQGCGLLFVSSRYNTCDTARVHADDTCNGVVACTKENATEMLPKWVACLGARKQQQQAFASGLLDVTEAKQTKWDKNAEKDIKAAINTIETNIEAGKGGHQRAIDLVTGSIAKCTPFVEATNEQNSKKGK